MGLVFVATFQNIGVEYPFLKSPDLLEIVGKSQLVVSNIT